MCVCVCVCVYVRICLLTIAKLYNNSVHLLFGDFPASEFYMPTFRNTVPSSQAVYLHRL